MMQIRPVSDLRNKFPEIEHIVVEEGQPVYLTKNGYGSMVIVSLELYAKLMDELEKTHGKSGSRSDKQGKP